MNTNKSILNNREVGGNYFFLFNRTTSDKYLNDYIDLFNPNEYHIFKMTRKQRLVSYEEFLEFKYSGYMFFKKELYSIDYINKWIDFWGELGGIQFLNKPFPPFNPDKIKIKS